MVDIYFDKLTCNYLFHQYANEFIEKHNLAFYENSRGTGTYYLDDAATAPGYLSMPLKNSRNVFYSIDLFNKIEYFTWLRMLPQHQIALTQYLYANMPLNLHPGLHENLSKIIAPENIAYALQEQPQLLAEYLQAKQSKKGSLWTTDIYYSHLLHIFREIDAQRKASILRNFIVANHDYLQNQASQKKMLAFIEQYIELPYQSLCIDLLDKNLVANEKIVEFATVSTALNYTIEIDKKELMANIKNIESKTQILKFTNEMVKGFVNLLKHKTVSKELGLLNIMLCSQNKSEKKYYLIVHHTQDGIVSAKILSLLTSFVIFYKDYYDPKKVIVAINKNNIKGVILKWYLNYSLQQQLPVNDIKKNIVKI